MGVRIVYLWVSVRDKQEFEISYTRSAISQGKGAGGRRLGGGDNRIIFLETLQGGLDCRVGGLQTSRVYIYLRGGVGVRKEERQTR